MTKPLLVLGTSFALAASLGGCVTKTIVVTRPAPVQHHRTVSRPPAKPSKPTPWATEVVNQYDQN